jgi:mono/diheme cytochrome c family protein
MAVLRRLIILTLLATPTLARAASASPTEPASLTLAKDVQPLRQTYCSACHGDEKHKGDVSFTPFKDDSAVQSDPKLWQTVLTQLGDYTMPPAKSKAQPTPPERDLLVAYVTHRLDHLDLSKLPKDPGRVTIHRLNRQEYNNTLRDLLGVYTNPADAFPADGGGGGGFDNNADTLFIPPILMEQYLHAAGDAAAAAQGRDLFVVRPAEGLPRRDAARKCLDRLLFRAFRRPVSGAEVERYLKVFDAADARGLSFDQAVRLVVKAVLVSPHFLFRVEKEQPSSEPYAINDFELASRLSYFIWASMPDDELFDLAKQNTLHDDSVIDAQVRRMLKSPRSKALAEHFGGQWLAFNAIRITAAPDRKKFPEFTDVVRDALYEQAVAFVDSVFRDDRPITTLIDADYTYLNHRLARYYNLPDVKGDDLRPVKLAGDNAARCGVLGLGAIHVVTSFPLRTSPVLRGKWVLETLLGAAPPPPPPDTPKLPDDDAPTQGLTFRQKLEKHRADPNCASCHARMDPLGFGLENFDPVGRWRKELAGQPVDAVGTLATGESFTGPVPLKSILMRKRDDFARTVTRKLLAYALGRGLEPYDELAVRKITDQLARSEYKSATLVAEVAKSYPFRYRRN